MKIREYTPLDQQPVISLWQECGLVHSQNNPEKVIALGYIDDRVVGLGKRMEVG